MPGVLMLEALAQMGGILIRHSTGITGEVEIFFASIDNARFRRPVRPGDSLFLEGEIISRKGPFWKLRCRALVEGEVVVEADLMGVIRQKRVGSDEE